MTVQRKKLILRWNQAGVLIIWTILFIVLSQWLLIQSYDFIRSADTYSNIAVSDAIVETGHIPPSRPLVLPTFADTRPNIVPLLGAFLQILTDQDTMIVYRAIMPLLLVVSFFCVLLLFIKNLSPDRYPIVFPVISLLLFFNPSPYSVGTLIGKALPQSFALLIFLILFYLLFRYVKAQHGRWRWLVLVLGVFGVWMDTHASYPVFSPILITTVAYRERAMFFFFSRYYFLPVAMGVLTVLLVVYFRWGEISWLLKYFLDLSSSTTISFAYIKNTLSPLFLLFSVLGAVVMIRTRGWDNVREKEGYHLTMFFAFIFFCSVWVLPKFGLMNIVYTYRFLPFFIITLVPLATYFLTFLFRRDHINIGMYITVCAMVLSLAWFSPHVEGGWIIGSEADIIPFLREHTPKDSIFFTQGVNTPLLMLAQKTIFVGGNRTEQQQRPATQNNLDIFLARSSKQAYDTILYSFDPDNPIYDPRWSYRPPSPDDLKRPKYVLYSKLKPKINEHWGEWWVKESYGDAHLNNFSNTRYFEKVWENSSVVLWKVKDNRTGIEDKNEG